MHSRLNHIDCSKPTEARAGGQSGPATLDSCSLRIGTIVPLSGTRLPATIVPGSMNDMILQNGKPDLKELEWVRP